MYGFMLRCEIVCFDEQERSVHDVSVDQTTLRHPGMDLFSQADSSGNFRGSQGRFIIHPLVVSTLARYLASKETMPPQRLVTRTASRLSKNVLSTQTRAGVREPWIEQDAVLEAGPS